MSSLGVLDTSAIGIKRSGNLFITFFRDGQPQIQLITALITFFTQIDLEIIWKLTFIIRVELKIDRGYVQVGCTVVITHRLDIGLRGLGVLLQCITSWKELIFCNFSYFSTNPDFEQSTVHQ